MKNTLLIVSLLLLICSGGCNSDVTELKTAKLMKSWQLVSMTKNGLPVSLTDCQKGELISFAEQSVCYLFFPCDSTDIKSGWSYDNQADILNISNFLPITYYVLLLDDENVSMSYYEYNSVGELDKYIMKYKSAQTTLQDGKLRLAQ